MARICDRIETCFRKKQRSVRVIYLTECAMRGEMDRCLRIMPDFTRTLPGVPTFSAPPSDLGPARSLR